MRTALVCVAIVLTAGCGWMQPPPAPTQHDHSTVDLDPATTTRVELRMGGGELDVTGGSPALLQGDFSYNKPALKPSITHSVSGTDSTVVVAQDTNASSGSHVENHWQLALNDRRPLTVEAHVLAGQARLRLGGLSLRGVDVSVTAGELDLDLRGTPTSSYHVNVNGGVGEVTVHVPATVAITASASGAIGDVEVTGLEKQDGRWINLRAVTSPVTIDLNVHGAVGQIKIVAD